MSSAAAPSPTSTRSSTATSPTPPTARRAGRPRSSSRSAPASSSGSRRRSACRRSTRSSATSCGAPSRRGGEHPSDRGARQPDRRAALDRVVRRQAARRPLPAPQRRRGDPQRRVRHPVAGRLLVRGPVRAPPARHRPRALARVRARDHRRMRGHQAGLGAGELQLLHQRRGVRVHRARRRRWSPSTAGSSCRSTASRSTPGCGGTRTARSSRRCASRSSPTTPTGGSTFPRHEDRAPESALAGYLAEAEALFASLPDPYADGEPAHVADERVSEDFEHLRWFDLPAESLRH